MRLIDADLLDEQELYNCNSVIEAIDYIMEQPTVNQWIPCSERLPEEKEILKNSGWFNATSIFEKKIHTEPACFIDGEWIDTIGFKNIKVIAWQPLPEPYKKEV